MNDKPFLDTLSPEQLQHIHATVMDLWHSQDAIKALGFSRVDMAGITWLASKRLGKKANPIWEDAYSDAGNAREDIDRAVRYLLTLHPLDIFHKP